MQSSSSLLPRPHARMASARMIRWRREGGRWREWRRGIGEEENSCWTSITLSKQSRGIKREKERSNSEERDMRIKHILLCVGCSRTQYEIEMK